jgi:thiol-disulfide isomerase/thioredoxin
VVQHALDNAALHQYMDRPAMAARIVQDIDEAMPKELPPDEAILIAAERRQYELIGTKMPELKGAVSLRGETETAAAKPVYGNVTVFLLFPPWCAQCVRLGPQLQPAIDREAGKSELKVYALLADVPPEPPKHVAGKNAADGAAKRVGHAAVHAPEEPVVVSPVELLRKTPTLVVPPEMLNVFGATDFPFLIATDHDGVIRLLYPAAPNNALVENGIVDQLTLNILSHWPPKNVPRRTPVAEAH